MATKLKDVATLANVSPSSVSRYINNPTSINAVNAFKIERAIQELNYVPNPVARSLKSGRSKLIGVIVPSMNSYFAIVCRAVSDFFFQQGYSVFFCESGENGEKESYYLKELLGLRFEGILLSTISSSKKDLQKLSESAHVVLVDRVLDVELDRVCEDNEELAYKLTKHMFLQGHDYILGLFGSSKSLHVQQRINGAMRAASEFPGKYFQPAKECYQHDIAFNTIKAAVSQTPAPTAIIGYGLAVTERMILSLNNLQLQVPQDIAIGCWALKDFYEKYRYNAPFVAEDPYEMGLVACDLLLQKINGRSTKPKTHIISAEFRP